MPREKQVLEKKSVPEGVMVLFGVEKWFESVGMLKLGSNEREKVRNQPKIRQGSISNIVLANLRMRRLPVRAAVPGWGKCVQDGPEGDDDECEEYVQADMEYHDKERVKEEVPRMKDERRSVAKVLTKLLRARRQGVHLELSLLGDLSNR